MEFKRSVVGAALFGAVAFSGSAFAGATGNVGAFSEYMFRGVEQSAGAAVQGGLDFSHSSGLYAGAWVSNTSFAGVSAANVSYETDVYAGYTTKFNDNFGIDVGALYYYYRDDTALNTIEYYAGLLVGAGSVKAYFTDDYFGTDDDGLYVTASYPIALSETLAVTPQVGFSDGDGVGTFVVDLFEPGADEDSYIDYSLTLAKTLEAGFTFSFAVIGTDLKDDDEKIVIGLKKSFDL